MFILKFETDSDAGKVHYECRETHAYRVMTEQGERVIELLDANGAVTVRYELGAGAFAWNVAYVMNATGKTVDIVRPHVDAKLTAA